MKKLITLIIQQISENDVQVNQEEYRGAESTTSGRGFAPLEAKQVKTRTKAKPRSKPKTQHETDTKLTKADMNELVDISNQFYTLLNRIDKIPNQVNDEIIKLKDSNYIVIEVI